MSEFRDLQAKLEKIDESYYSRLAAAVDDIALYNKRMPDDELVELIRTELGDQAAEYMRDKLASGERIEEEETAHPSKDRVKDEMTMDEISAIGREHGLNTDDMWKAVIFAHDNDMFWEMEMEVRTPEGNVVGRYPDFQSVPSQATDPATGETFTTDVDNIFVIYKTDPQQVTDMIGWYKKFEKEQEAKKKQQEYDMDFDSWLEKNPFESIEEAEEDKWAGGDQQYKHTDKWLGQTVNITGGVHQGKTGKVIKAERSGYSEVGEEAEFTVKFYDGSGVDVLYVGEWTNDQLELAYDPTHRPDGKYNPDLEEGTFRNEEDSISVQVRSLLAQGKSVISRIAGASGVVMDANPEDGTILFKDQNFGEKVGLAVDRKPGLEIKGYVDHYAIVQHAEESIDEEVVEVPAEFRGEKYSDGGATSQDAERFLANLDPDDSVDTEVIDPESGEVLDWPTKDVRKAQDHEEYMRNAEQREKEEEEKWESIFSTPHIPGGKSAKPGQVQGFEGMDRALEDLGKLKWDEQINDFYDITWKSIEDLVDDPEMYYKGDYDIGWDFPVEIKRTDGKKFDKKDHANFRRLSSLFRTATWNIGAGYAGGSEGSTVAHFYPMFY
jgi:hypothetical protein